MSFKLIYSANVNGVIPVKKYKSETTGLTVIHAGVEGPVVNGYFTLATEAHDDDGLPHTLEHLIFLGSELYPYKGVLDLVANRCLASGTNAWTDTDHTCYTMTTAGAGGFLSLLPVYLDHILYPTLTDAGFITEVHHISGDGDDGGVVYCEMQGRENSGESLINMALVRTMYPNSGYSSETGGIMKNLRESTTNKKVRDYHAQFYRPDNLVIIVTGQVLPEDLFKAIKPLEDRIVAKGALPPFERPWQTPVAPLEKSQDLKIFYPADEEDCGLVNVGWRGPNCSEENLTLTACSVLLRYLSDTSVSPLQRDFVEIEDPFASKVGYNITENLESLIYFLFENVPLSKIDSIHPRLQMTLNKIANGEEKIDMRRMYNIIERQILESLSSLENSPHDDVAFHLIGYVLYGNSEKNFIERLNGNEQLYFLQKMDEQYWLELLQKYLIDGNYVVVRAVPSIEKQQTMAKEENERIEKQREDLGEEGLSVKENELANAMATNEISCPDEMLTRIPVPSKEGMKFHPVEIFRSDSSKNLNPTGLDLQSIPIFAEAYNVHTNFAYLTISMNTESLTPNLRMYLPLLLELLMESPVRRGDVLIPHEEVVQALEADTISADISLGLESSNHFSCGPFANTATITLQVEQKKYDIGINWLAELLFKTEFVIPRIKVCAAKMANDVAQLKREGDAVARYLVQAMFYSKESNVQLVSILKQQKFLNQLIQELDDANKAENIIRDLNEVRDNITSLKNLGAHIAADWDRLSELGFDLNVSWSKISNSREVPARGSLTVIPDWKLFAPQNDGKSSDSTGSVVGIGCVESAFLFQASPAINDFNDPDLPPLMLFLQYLTQLEGPLWRQIRGQGFAYGYSITPKPQEGLLYLSLYRASNLINAYKEAKRITEGQLQADAKWDPTLLESAKSSLIFQIIDREKSVGDVVSQSILSSFKHVPVEYNKNLVKNIDKVTTDDLNRVGKLYVTPLFTASAKTAIVCHPDKANDISAFFNQMGHRLTIGLSIDDSILGAC